MELDKKALDRYLTTEPSDGGFQSWVEKVWDNITDRDIPDPEYAMHEDFFDQAHDDLFNQALDPIHASNIIINRYHLMVLHKLTTWREAQEFFNRSKDIS